MDMGLNVKAQTVKHRALEDRRQTFHQSNLQALFPHHVSNFIIKQSLNTVEVVQMGPQIYFLFPRITSPNGKNFTDYGVLLPYKRQLVIL